MKARAKTKCFYDGVLYKEDQVVTFSDDKTMDDDFKEFFEVIDKPKRSKKSDSTSNSESSAT